MAAGKSFSSEGDQSGWPSTTGQVDDADVDSVYSFLQRALREAPPDFPVRGPEAFTEGPFAYRNAYEGDAMSFWGQETIHTGGRLVYTARYGGGLVDRRKRRLK